jgi:hypothetical protein
VEKLGEFIAVLADIKDIDKVPDDFKGLVNFKAKLEGREIRGDERVAILNVANTFSYIPVFLDRGKTIEEVEREVEEGAHAKLNVETRNILKNVLSGMKKI